MNETPTNQANSADKAGAAFPTSDEQFVLAFSKGSSHAFEELFSRYSSLPRLLNSNHSVVLKMKSKAAKRLRSSMPTSSLASRTPAKPSSAFRTFFAPAPAK